jgi:hypothetical protein
MLPRPVLTLGSAAVRRGGQDHLDAHVVELRVVEIAVVERHGFAEHGDDLKVAPGGPSGTWR